VGIDASGLAPSVAAVPDSSSSAAVPARVRFQVPLTLFPFLVGIATVVPLWGVKAQAMFFATAAETIALGAVAMALQGRFFRVADTTDRSIWAIVSNATMLIAVGVGMAFAFGALIRGDAGEPHVAMTTGGLAMGVSAFVVQAFFGTPGSADPADA
jgi:hypothetical protein